MTAARAVAQAKDYVAAKKAAGELKAALERNAKTNDLTDLSSTPPASLAQLMKEVPILNTRLKRNVQGERLKSEAKETAGSSAVIAAIAVGSISSTEAAKTPCRSPSGASSAWSFATRPRPPTPASTPATPRPRRQK